MNCTRRHMLAQSLGALSAVAGLAETMAATPQRSRMGLVHYCYGLRRTLDKEARLDDPLVFLEQCRSVGAGGMQLALGVRDEAFTAKLRREAEANQLYVEGIIRLPREKAELERFDLELRTARRSGVKVFRTALGNRRYEDFDSADAFRKFAADSWQALVLAKPLVEKHEIQLAVENHKDWRIDDLLEMLQKLKSPFVGVCVDTGNSVALLEAPLEAVEAFAPFAFTTHIKDMGVEEYAEGFLLSEVPLGTGFLDLPKVFAILKKARPEIRFNLEMLTRDPLKIPCLTRKYWATLEHLPARRLAETLAMVRAHAAKKPLPRIGTLNNEDKIKVEDDNVKESLRFSRERLGV